MTEHDYKGYTIKIDLDPDPQNPRTEYDNYTTMVCFHKKYNLGDRDHAFKSEDYTSWFKLEIGIRDMFDGQIAAILPVYMYDHSGITIKTTPYSCPWDSGQIGFIFLTRRQANDALGDSWTEEQCLALMRQDVADYNRFLRGDSYVYIIEKDGVQQDCCGGFDDDEWALVSAKELVDVYAGGEQ